MLLHVQILPATVRCLHVTDLAVGGDYGGLDCLASVPIAMFDFAFLGRDLWPKLSPAFRTAVLHGLLMVCNWFRELINSYGFAQRLNCTQVCWFCSVLFLDSDATEVIELSCFRLVSVNLFLVEILSCVKIRPDFCTHDTGAWVTFSL